MKLFDDLIDETKLLTTYYREFKNITLTKYLTKKVIIIMKMVYILLGITKECVSTLFIINEKRL